MSKNNMQNSPRLNARQVDLAITKMLREQTPLYKKTLGTYTAALGQTLRVKLSNVGLTTRLYALVTVNTTTTVAAINLNAKGLEAFVPRVSVSDYDGTLRTNVSAFHLKMRNNSRKKFPKGFGKSLVDSATNGSIVNDGKIASLVNPNFNGAVAAGVNQQFMIEVPVCKDQERGDYRGILNTQTTQGDVHLLLDFCSQSQVVSATLNDDNVFNSATGVVAVNSITVEVVQEYHMIQAIDGQVTLPQYSTSVVYALEGYTRTSDNIVAGMEKLIAFPNARIIHSFLASYTNNGRLAGGAALSATDLTRIKLIANAGNYITDLSTYQQLFMQRESLGNDFNAGVYYMDFDVAPIVTDIYGNVQAALVPGATVTNPNIEMTFESLYVKGAALSGINQSS
jgi:hypothetical protein